MDFDDLIYDEVSEEESVGVNMDFICFSSSDNCVFENESDDEDSADCDASVFVKSSTKYRSEWELLYPWVRPHSTDEYRANITCCDNPDGLSVRSGN